MYIFAATPGTGLAIPLTMVNHLLTFVLSAKVVCVAVPLLFPYFSLVGAMNLEMFIVENLNWYFPREALPSQVIIKLEFSLGAYASSSL